ncbi:PssE/Cps14G family polysaccharide biosynthesis glycosyltransferase [Grimontia sp. SpTr1]|uniref:PssE/Cps14G family polysaccharide biosynthesis glycosyltransferase n=1 Tax=Grimontia sp. SpTr1 TaxID=2995319 RepID=UPI00248B8D3A|nr:PssE/Cps14G family polysaccharide biosynthesis glycosyltransferase [Grimontia sp. SpTr1]
MKNILVTVGTYSFDSLIRKVDHIRDADYNFSIQYGSGEYVPRNHDSFSYSSDFDSQIECSDLVITHAGAGNVYSLLERNKKIVVVPNLQRVDDHQKELALFIESEFLGEVCYDVNEIEVHLKRALYTSYNHYAKVDFFIGLQLHDELHDFFDN